MDFVNDGIDILRVYFGDDFRVNQYITIHQPTIDELVEYGEERYLLLVQMLTAIPSDMKSALFDAGMDWMQVPDLQLFYMLSTQLTPDDTRILFGDLDFSRFKLAQRSNGEFVMLNPDGVAIDRNIHHTISEYLCMVHHIKKKVENAYNRITKEVLIEEDRDRRKKASKEQFKSSLFSMISALINCPGFKYDLNGVRKMKLFEFYDSVVRVQTIVNTTGLMQGFYSGSIDPEKFDTKKLDFMRDLY